MKNRFFWEMESGRRLSEEPPRVRPVHDTLCEIGMWVIVIIMVLGIPGAAIWGIVESEYARIVAVIFVAVVLIAEMVKVFFGKKVTYHLNHYDEGSLDDSIRPTGSVDKKEGS